MYYGQQGIRREGAGDMAVTITQERPDSPDAVMLITELSDYLDPLYPKWNQFGLSSDRLINEGVAFFITRVDGVPAGCGGVKFCPRWGELKRMYVRPQFRGTGLGKLMLKHLETYRATARDDGVATGDRHLPAGSHGPLRTHGLPADRLLRAL